MIPHLENSLQVTRRHFLRNCQIGLGGIALATLLGESRRKRPTRCGRAPGISPPRRRTSSICTWPARRRTSISSITSRSWCGIPARIAPSRSCAAGASPSPPASRNCSARRSASASMADRGRGFPARSQHIPTIADELCFIKSMHTEQFNHAPAELLLFTGSPQFGRPSMGSWVTYGLGSESQDLPGFIALVSSGTFPSAGNADWNNGFLPSVYQGVQCRSQGDPVLYVSNPDRHGFFDAPPEPRCVARLERNAGERARQSGDAHAHRPVRTRLPHADRRPRGDGHQPRIAARDRRLRRPAGRGELRQQLPAGPPSDRARRPLRAAS